MQEKLALSTMKSNSISITPTFLTSRPHNFPRRNSSNSYKIQPLIFNQIKQDPQENKISPKTQIKRSQDRSFSQNQIKHIQNTKIQNKLRIKNKIKSRAQDQMIMKDKNNNDDDSGLDSNNNNKNNFAEQYQIHLRKTVFNETKLMLKTKRNKASHSFQTFNHDYEYGVRLEKTRETSVELENKISLHSKRKRQQKNGVDSLYRTIAHNQKLPRLQVQYDYLEAVKFPLSLRTKEGTNLNYSNLLSNLNEKEKQIPRFCKPGIKPQKIRLNSNKILQISPQKHEINPWQTFADQFYE